MPTYRRPIRVSPSKLPLRLAPHLKQAPRAIPPSISRHLLSASKRIPVSSTNLAAIPASVAVTLPVPPSINHQYATVNGRRLLSSAGRSYKAQVGQIVWLNLAKTPHRSALLTQLQSSSLALTIRFYFSSALRRDVDGGLKIAQDALCEGLGLNDNRIVETHLYKHVDKTNPRIEACLSTTSNS